MIHPPKRQTRSLPDPFNSRIVNDCELLFIVVIFGANSMWTDIRANRAYSYTSYFAVSQCHRKYIFKVNLIFAHCHVSLPEGTPFRILYLLVASCWSNHPVPLRRNIGNVPSRFIDTVLVLSVGSFVLVGRLCLCVHVWSYLTMSKIIYVPLSPTERITCFVSAHV